MFLKQVAQTLYNDYKSSISKLHIILPTRRACLYFKTFLAELIEETLFSPKVFSLEDFITHAAGLELEDTSALIFELYDSYRKYDANVAGSLERFAPLGTTMLSDFNLIDRNLVKADELFEYLDEVKTLERWGELLGEMDLPSSRIKDYYQFWRNIHQTYLDFRQKLNDAGRAYPGMAFRWVAEHVERIIEEQEIECAVFIGFNQLYKAEQTLIQQLKRRNKARLFWDMDNFFVKNTWHEAGNYFRKFIENGLVDKKDKIEFLNTLITTKPKNIEVISVVNTITQAKIAGHLLAKMIDELVANNQFFKFKATKNHTAILLPDEAMLLPMLYSLPQSTEGVKIQELVNITMGVSLKNTPLFTLVRNIFQMQENILRDEQMPLSVYHKDLIRILQHPYIRPSKEDENPPLQRIHEENLIYMSIKELSDYKVNGWMYGQLFEDWNGNVHKAVRSFFKIIEVLAHRFAEESFSLESEYLFEFYKILKQIERMVIDYAPAKPTPLGNAMLNLEKAEQAKQKEDANLVDNKALKIPLSIAALEKLLIELMRNSSIPFTGEPIAPIQIMGMLESRALDFENLIIISANEGIFPRGKVLTSSIPFDIRLQFGLPTHTEDDASYAYTFYRLLQRSKKITLIYASDMEGMRSGEPSRFVYQLRSELAPLDNITFTEKRLELPLPTPGNCIREIEKTPAILKRLKTYLTEEGLSPSYISRYLEEPMRFYEQKILQLADPPMMEEDLFQHTYGEVMHKALETIFEAMVGKEITVEWLDKTKNDKENLKLLVERLITDTAGGVLHDQGKNYLLKEVTQSLIPEFLRLQKDDVPIRLLALEQRLQHILPITVKDKTIKLKLIGTADRIDISTNKDGQPELRIIDYKTGKADASQLKADNFEDLLTGEKAKVVQLLLYKYLFVRAYQAQKIKNLPTDFTLETYPIVSGFWFFRKLGNRFTPYNLKIEKNLTLEGFLAETETFLQRIVEQMLDEQIPFTEQTNLDLFLEEFSEDEA